MNPARLRLVGMSGWLAAWLIATVALPAQAQNVARALPTRTPVSPVETFRKLLAMSPEELDQYLSRYPAAKREQVLAKVQEYRMLPPDFREQRLTATELRWYLLPLLRNPPADPAERLQQVPEPYREMIEARLNEWQLWPPELKKEVIEYDLLMHYLVSRDASGRASYQSPSVIDAKVPAAAQRNLARWLALPADQRQLIFDRVKHYFELKPDEQEKVLESLSQRDRQQTEKVLDPLEKWPEAQQDQYFAAFSKFAEMSPEARQQFMKNAERWQKMSPAERQAWRDLLRQLPPLPPGFVPPGQENTAGAAASGRTNPTAAPR